MMRVDSRHNNMDSQNDNNRTGGPQYARVARDWYCARLESMTAWLWWRTVIESDERGAKSGSSSNGSPSICHVGIRWKWFERGTGCEQKMGAPRI